MVAKIFALLGTPEDTREIVIDFSMDYDDLCERVATEFSIAVPSGVGFQSSGNGLNDISDIVDANETIEITIDGNRVRDPPGPSGLPFVGSYYEVYPDHLGNHQRLFEQYGPVVKTTDMGRTTYYTNDPRVATICMNEDGFWAKMINEDHPLYGIKNEHAGVFLSDSNTEAWHQVHKFLAPALSPKAVRHYTPHMQHTGELSFKVFDQLESMGEAWNVYQYMFKVGSTAIGKLALNMDLHHFDSVDAPLHKLVMAVGESLELNKKISTRGAWYGRLPFGDPAKLRSIMKELEHIVDESIQSVDSTGSHDLPIKEAALEASCVVDYLSRAKDPKGNKLDEKYLAAATIVTVGAGFVTTASLLSWLLFSVVTYPGNQERLLQELVDNGVNHDTVWTPDLALSLPFLDNFIKEVQRLHNPSYQPGRTAMDDVIVPGGYRIPKDAVMIVAIHHIHNNPAVWADPHRFNPDRWDTAEVRNRDKGSYMPFAAGPRMCIGFNFALQEVRVILSMLIYRYEFSKVGDDAVEYDPSFQLIRPVNLYVKTKKRTVYPKPTQGSPAAKAS
ncbi:cytochrome P450 [Phlyctema vagabunda]|uniref:Cytochrome P450 n=1 Tax=Phlyctema vagabunda TaxID=108571 RepID=A0ABR4PPM4_9HELO